MIWSRPFSRIPVTCAFAASVFATAALPLTGVMPVAAQEVVQPLPDPASEDLSDALRRLSRDPENVRALVDAGNASLALGDTTAAFGFFRRAQIERPDDGRMLAGLAQVAVRRGEGVTAVQLFDNANAAGASLMSLAADRGLAYDLIGNYDRAQRLYRQALARGPNDEVTRRLALSLAISGDAAASESTLLPLLQRQDRSAFRTRAFALAILGQENEAITIAETMLPPRLSGRLAPYLRYMPRLTPAQQAAAANLGRFPAASQIGRDTPQVAALAESGTPAAAQPSSPNLAAADRLTPSGPPLGRSEPESDPAMMPAAVSAPITQPVTQPVSEPVYASVSGELPALVSAQTSIAGPSQARSAPAEPVLVAVLNETTNAATTNAPAAAQQPRPSFALAEPEPEPAQTDEQIDLAEAFADFTLPGNGSRVAPAAGAVDITAIEPAREVARPARAPAPEPAPPPPPAHPSRHWVQVATGQDLAAFRFDWRRIVRNADGALDGREAYTVRWNQTNRLVTGPFDSARAANQFVAELGDAGIDSFRFTSAQGEEVRPIG